MNLDHQVERLMQGTEFGDEETRKVMASELRQRLAEAGAEGRPLQVYAGFDPRTADLHLGHTVILRKLRQFQDLGHVVTFLVGTYTSLIGDPSDKDRLRPLLSPEQVEHNAATYAGQANLILDPEMTRMRFNADWLAKITFGELIQLASNFTVQQFLARDNFKLRQERGDAIYLHETFYPLMQGYDAFMLKADVQVGGTDQSFSIVQAARKIMTSLGARPNIAIIMGILPGTDGEIKMSKSLGNHIALNLSAEELYGKLMSLPDRAMPRYFRLVTRWNIDQITEIEGRMASGQLHLRDAKMMLAREIVSMYHGENGAARAEEAFVRVFQRGGLPEDMPQFRYLPSETILEVLIRTGLAASRSEARRLLSQNGIRLDGDLLNDPNQVFPHPGVLQAGKRRFVQLRG